MTIGANYLGEGTCEFSVWAPLLEQVELHLLPNEAYTPMQRDDAGFWSVTVDNVSPGARYCYRLERGRELPDPASFSQPAGVHEPSQIVDHAEFIWEDAGWEGVAPARMVIYELHVGTFTGQGTFDAVIEHLTGLQEIGINTIEIMPVAQFPGERNWGYDGVYPFAVQSSYGGHAGLKRLVNACHRMGMAVLLDVVYNHLGPEGNYLREYGPYFTDRYRTPWGEAINLDGEYSTGVRSFFTENALYWMKHFHIDGLRIDAIHGMHDMSARPFLRELAERVEKFSRSEGRKYYLIAESDLNNSYVVRPPEEGGYGFDAQWCDDFHHAVHTLITGESSGYYLDFGKTEDLVKSLKEGFVYSGRYSRYRKRNHGNPSHDISGRHFVVFSQNHDQTGNRMNGERLSSLVSFEALKLVAGITLLAPYIPLVFMGEEYGETSPFLYFVSHSDPALIEAVRRGRKNEFNSFHWDGDPPDPQSAETFLKSRLNWSRRETQWGSTLLGLYRTLIRFRKKIYDLSSDDSSGPDVLGDEEKMIITMERSGGENPFFAVFNFSEQDEGIPLPHSVSGWEKVIDSSDITWEGPGTLLPERLQAPGPFAVRKRSFAVYQRERK